MKIREILVEAINLTGYAPEFKREITDALIQAIDIPDDKLRTVKNDLSNDSLTSASELIKTYLGHSLKFYLEKTLSKLASKIFVPDGSSRIPVTFKQIEDQAHVDGLEVVFSTALLDTLSDELVDLVYTAALDWNEGDLFASFRDTVSNRDKRLVQIIKHDYKLSEKTIPSFVSTFIHELTHIAQHFPQYVKGRVRDNLEYRSYVDKDKTFHKSFASRHTPEGYPSWHKMYIASPQEIGARAQEFAMKMLDSEGLLYPQYTFRPNEIPSTKEVGQLLSSYIDEWYPEPTTPQERSVRNRYYKLAYQQIDRHLEQLRTKAKEEFKQNT